ncbi:hypothetical protein G7K_6296-t1 [Saitoella complicata NRRL Y-17804]|uniref:Uncharacterized protein n=1 Tax=Saitoella complicata (strain BCRC 22490 / CBS 7301 / JCM 7358 / NBRC 10748 / NRRL Y-17804) TaxID=698492 RepID=A0A0E9NQZ2_SAICN|nr:hypothetical protein G7K_6296-t1 [Saitoella complicata NRRL Y-17804]
MRFVLSFVGFKKRQSLSTWGPEQRVPKSRTSFRRLLSAAVLQREIRVLVTTVRPLDWSDRTQSKSRDWPCFVRLGSIGFHITLMSNRCRERVIGQSKKEGSQMMLFFQILSG